MELLDRKAGTVELEYKVRMHTSAFRDITEGKREQERMAQERLSALTLENEQLHKDLAAEREYRRMMQDTAEKEREANRLKSGFLSNMSHEIRTPMNAIIGLAEAALSKEQPKETKDMLKKINISSANLLQIVNDILDLSKIEADKLELFPEKFELEEVLGSTLLVVSPRLDGKPVELMLDVDPGLPRFMVGDRVRLWQILKNFLDNAAKFTRKGGIILTVKEDKRRSDDEKIFVSFETADTGIGMTEAQLRKAFLPYEQVCGDVRKRYAGTGLGLPLSKRLCELMGGTLAVKSEPGKGTALRFTVPFGRSQGNETEDLCPTPLSGLKVLAVNDNERALSILGGLLESRGADTVMSGGKRALELISEGRDFDVIVFDSITAGADGNGEATLIRRKAAASKLLLITGGSQAKAQAAACRADAVIDNPFVPSEFIQKLLEISGLGIAPVEEPPKVFTQFRDARVLVCEDNFINQDVAACMLERFGIDPVFADNGSQGLRLLDESESFDLILMDLHMPVMDGYEAARRIRSESRFDGVPIVSLTADAMTEVADKCRAVGMNDYISKPIEMDELYNICLKWL